MLGQPGGQPDGQHVGQPDGQHVGQNYDQPVGQPDEQVLDEYDSVQQQLEVEVSAHLACQQVKQSNKQLNNYN